MNDVGRFERGARYSVVRDITTYRGVDPLTGLDVLIYDFPGAPTAAAGSVASDNIPQILASASNGGRGSVVSAMPHGADLVAPGERMVDDRFVLQALVGIRDAHALGLVHGDISASRLLHSRSQVYIEGYGVPWGGEAAATGEAALHADLQALLRALLGLADDNLSAEVTAALKGASAKGSYPPMNAPRLHAIVRRLAGGAVKVPAAGFNDLTLPISETITPTSPATSPAASGGEKPETASELPRNHAAAEGPKRPKSSPPRAVDARPPADVEFDDPEPITLNSDPGLTPHGQTPSGTSAHARNSAQRSSAADRDAVRSTHDTSPGFVKALPPGATYRDGNVDDDLRPAPIRFDRQEAAAARRRGWRGPALLVLVLLVAALAASLTVISQQQNAGAATPGQVYPVDVRVEPANLPPIQMIVDQSPPGSTIAAGTVMGATPRRHSFDAVGTWVVHGKFQERVTPPVTLSIPEDTTITLVFPAAEPEQP